MPQPWEDLPVTSSLYRASSSFPWDQLGLGLEVGVARESPISWLSRASRTCGIRAPVSSCRQAINTGVSGDEI